MNTKLHQKTISKAFPISRNALITELILFSLLGALAVVLRAKLRIPINMPGHHGLEVMAILLIGRFATKIPIATTISSMVSAIFIYLSFLGFNDPFLPVIYIMMGVSIDIMYYFAKKNHTNFLIYALIGGIAYMIIPLSRILIHFLTGYEYMTFIKKGFIIPVASHFIFGVAGGLLATTMVNYTKKQLNKNK